MYDKYKISELLYKLDVNKGDTLIMHSDAMALAQFNGIDQVIDYNNFFENILDCLGANGTLVLPTFTYSATNRKIFYPSKTKSEVGVISNKFLDFDGVQRTKNPIFSFGEIGKNKDKLLKIDDYTCFGKNSIFANLYELSAKIICLGCSTKNSITFMHHLEEKALVPYRKYIFFDGVISENKKSYEVKCEYYARDLNLEIDTKPSLDLFTKFIKKLNSNLILEKSYGRLISTSLSSKLFYDYGYPLLVKYPLLFIEEGEKVYKDICL